MKAILWTFAVTVCCSFFTQAQTTSTTAENYSLWPKRPDQLITAKKLMEEGKDQEALALLDDIFINKGVGLREAQELIGQIRVREELNPRTKNKIVYTVKRGDAWFGIAKKQKCQMDMIMYLNQMMDLGALQIGQKLIIHPMDLKIVIRPKQQQLFLFRGDTLIKAYPIVAMKDAGGKNVETTIKSEYANISLYAPEYPSADKALKLAAGNMLIDIADGRTPQTGMYLLSKADCNEVALLTHPGNIVEIIRE